MKPGAFKRFCRRCAIGFGVLFVIVGLFLLEEHIRGRIELNAWMKEMRARGEKFTITELTPAPAPPDQSGALVLMNAVFPNGGVVPDHVPSAMWIVGPAKAVALMDRPLWTTGIGSIRLATNGVTKLWRRRMEFAEPALVTREQLHQEIAANSNALHQVCAALEFPVVDYSLDYSRGTQLLMPHLPNEKAAAQWLRAACLDSLFAANHEEALKYLLALSRLAHSKTNEPILMSQLTQMAILDIAIASVWEALQLGGWNDDQIARLESAWDSHHCMASVVRALEMERAMSLQEIDRVANDFAAMRNLLRLHIEFPGFSIWMEDRVDVQRPARSTMILVRRIGVVSKEFVHGVVWRIAWKDQDKLLLLKTWQPVVERARRQAESSNWLEHRMNVWDRPAEEILYDHLIRPDNHRHRVYVLWRYWLSTHMAGVGSRTLRSAVRAEIIHRLTHTAIAVERWKVKHGHPPNSLNDLTPKLLSTVPDDPVDGKPLRYRQNPDGTFLLYSIGANGKDDGGDPSPEKPDLRPNFTNGRDVVWPQRASPGEIEEFEKQRGPFLRP